MYWSDRKQKPYGWEPIWAKGQLMIGHYKRIMDIMNKQSTDVFYHYYSSLIARKKWGRVNEDPRAYLDRYEYLCKYHLIEMFAGMKYSKFIEMQMQFDAKRKGQRNYFINSNLTRASFEYFFQNPQKYKILNWDILCPYDEEMNDFNRNKITYQIEYEEYLPKRSFL